MTSSLSVADLHKRAISKWLSETFTFTHFITLTSNSSDISVQSLRDRIKHWDALVNRELYGPKWRKHYDEILWWFAFMEKPETNPHWHLLCRFQDVDKLAKFTVVAEMMWLKTLPSGTVDIQPIKENPERVNDYVTKRVGSKIQYDHFITPDEFRRS